MMSIRKRIHRLRPVLDWYLRRRRRFVESRVSKRMVYLLDFSGGFLRYHPVSLPIPSRLLVSNPPEPARVDLNR